MKAQSNTERIQTYREFWPFYLAEHSLPKTRNWHLFGTLIGFFLSVFLIAIEEWLWLPITAVPSYGCAWYSHFFIQKNRPATFRYPFWSLISDYRMAYLMMRGKLN